MSNRIKGFTVILADNIREEDFDSIRNAVMCLKGVQDVTPHIVVPDDYIAASQATTKIVKKIFDFVHREILGDPTRT